MVKVMVMVVRVSVHHPILRLQRNDLLAGSIQTARCPPSSSTLFILLTAHTPLPADPLFDFLGLSLFTILLFFAVAWDPFFDCLYLVVHARSDTRPSSRCCLVQFLSCSDGASPLLWASAEPSLAHVSTPTTTKSPVKPSTPSTLRKAPANGQAPYLYRTE